MSLYIIKLNDMYLEYSTEHEVPVTFGMNRLEMLQYLIKQYGIDTEVVSEQRLNRCDWHTSSSSDGLAAKHIIWGNRAGPNEDELSTQEMYDAYCVRKPIRNGWMAKLKSY